MIPNSNPVLVGQGGSLNGYRWTIADQLTIGRSASCDITISSQQVSRKHAQITNEQAGVFIEDLQSKNGSYHNGVPVTGRIELEDGDLIQIALAQEFIFLSQDATVPLDASDFEGSPLSITPQLRLDKDSRRVWIGQKEITPPLSSLQFTLLQILLEQEGKVINRNRLINLVWKDQSSEGVTDQALDALIRRLRDRLSSAYPGHEYIVTIRGQGFRFDNPS